MYFSEATFLRAVAVELITLLVEKLKVGVLQSNQIGDDGYRILHSASEDVILMFLWKQMQT